MKHADYVRALRPLLPKEAFAADPTKLIPACLHLCVIIACWLGFRVVAPIFWPVLSIIAGHSIACCGLIAHELTHGSVVRGRALTYPLELLLWGVNFVPPTLWRKLHNECHHSQPNGIDDPDRGFVADERSPGTILFATLFFPSRWFKYNPFCLLHFITYITRHGIAVFYPGERRPVVNTGKPRYTLGNRLQIAGEFVFLVGLQAVVFVLVGRSWAAYAFAGPIAICLTSAVVIGYIATNHMLNPIGPGNDPVAATTSVTVPRIFDLLHSNFSYHTEHHLFPSMNSKFYPVLSRLLREKFGPEYHSLPLTEAWSRLWQVEYFTPYARADKPGTGAAA